MQPGLSGSVRDAGDTDAHVKSRAKRTGVCPPAGFQRQRSFSEPHLAAAAPLPHFFPPREPDPRTQGAPREPPVSGAWGTLARHWKACCCEPRLSQGRGGGEGAWVPVPLVTGGWGMMDGQQGGTHGSGWPRAVCRCGSCLSAKQPKQLCEPQPCGALICTKNPEEQADGVVRFGLLTTVCAGGLGQGGRPVPVPSGAGLSQRQACALRVSC